MIANFRARYSNGVLTPLEPLDLEEGVVVTLTIIDESLPEMFERLRASVPPDTWDNIPADGAKNYKHYLYGHPKEEDQ